MKTRKNSTILQSKLNNKEKLHKLKNTTCNKKRILVNTHIIKYVYTDIYT